MLLLPIPMSYEHILNILKQLNIITNYTLVVIGDGRNDRWICTQLYKTNNYKCRKSDRVYIILSATYIF